MCLNSFRTNLVYMTFVDLTKAVDTVSRDGLWKIMADVGCPPRYIAMVRQFHDGMQARVQNDGEYSEPFPVTNGVKQGCVMTPTLFSMMFSAMFTYAFQDVIAGFPISYRFDGKLLNLRIFQLGPWNRLLRIEQSGVASSTKVPPNLKEREYVKLKGSVKKGKQEPRDHHQTRHSLNSLVAIGPATILKIGQQITFLWPK